MLIRSHRVAQAAYEKVKEQARNKEAAGKYGALALSLPGLILQNGLAQATGFLLAKGRQEHLDLLNDLADVLRQSGVKGCSDGSDYHRTVIGADLTRTMQLTRRSLEAAGWIKRYVQGVLKVDGTDEGEA